MMESGQRRGIIGCVLRIPALKSAVKQPMSGKCLFLALQPFLYPYIFVRHYVKVMPGNAFVALNLT